MQQGSICYGVLNGVYVIKFSGEIRVPTCASLNAFTQVLLDDPALQGVIIDLTGINYIDSTGLGFVYICRHFPEADGLVPYRREIGL